MRIRKNLALLLCLVLLTGMATFACAKEDEYNEADLAAYAACVNSLAVEYGVPTILWDCSVHVNRKELKENTPGYVEAIMACYPADRTPGNGGDPAVFEEESALDAAAHFGPGFNLGNTLDSTSYNLNDAKAGLGSHLDRHASLGAGTLGWTVFEKLMQDPRLDNIPLVLETVNADLWREEIAKLQSFAPAE